jgi:HAD superfamily hydrolase (TIGR01509 family)
MLRAFFFDFNGVLVDDEPLHCALFQKTLAEKNITLSRDDYYQKYLGFDDHDAFAAVLKDRGQSPTEEFLQSLIETKAQFYNQEMKEKDLFVPGAVEFVKKIADQHYLGIVSGALRREIMAWLSKGGIQDCFQSIVAAEDTQKGKPDPEGYLRGLDSLNRDFVPSSEIVLPQECLVIEDSIWGIEAANKAGMNCVAISTSYSQEELKTARAVYQNFSEMSPESLGKLFPDR